MYQWLIKLVSGPLMPFLEGIGKFISAQLMKLSYIKQGKKEQLLDDLKASEKNAEDAAKLRASTDGLSDDELKLLLDGGRKKPRGKQRD